MIRAATRTGCLLPEGSPFTVVLVVATSAKRRNGNGARSANGAARDSVQFSVEPRHCMLLGEKSEFLHSVAAFPPRGAYGPQGSTCPRSESGGVRALRVTASLASPAI